MSYAVLAALLLLFYPLCPAIASSGGKCILADFDNAETSPVMGVTVKNPLDNAQSLLMEFANGGPHLEKGRSLYLDYDVDSFQPAKGIFWVKHADIGISTLRLYES